ncbi:MAG: tetratricopeptide repeat protein [Pseudomonadota bacterium]
MQPLLCALGLSLLTMGAAGAQSVDQLTEDAAELERLLDALRAPDLETWEATENKIIGIWARSGSATADLMLERAQTALEEEDYSLAVEHLSALIDHAPDFAEAWHTRATAFYHLGEHGLALGDLRQALALNPDHFGALTGLGVVLEELGDYDAALAAMRMAYALNPHRDRVGAAIERLRYALGRATL